MYFIKRFNTNQYLKRCVVYRNYNTAMAIVGGLSLAAISRLKRTWKVCNI